MKKVGDKIKEARKAKGLSQEELADLAKVNLRTIQRIESNHNEPRGKTLSLICDVLKINAKDILDYGRRPDKKYLIYFHLSVLTFLAIPIGNIILPLVLWLTKRDQIIGLEKIGANVLNFQIFWTVLTFLSISAYAFFKIMHFGTVDIMLYIFFGLYAVNIILPIVFALKTKEGQIEGGYPTPFRLIK